MSMEISLITERTVLLVRNRLQVIRRNVSWRSQETSW